MENAFPKSLPPEMSLCPSKMEKHPCIEGKSFK